MKIDYSFFIKINEDGKRTPCMTFFPPRYEMLSHLGFDDYSNSKKVKEIIDEINYAMASKTRFDFASDDWCIIQVHSEVSRVINGFDEFDPFELETSFIIKLLNDWVAFLEKYENNKIPGLI